MSPEMLQFIEQNNQALINRMNINLTFNQVTTVLDTLKEKIAQLEYQVNRAHNLYQTFQIDTLDLQQRVSYYQQEIDQLRLIVNIIEDRQ